MNDIRKNGIDVLEIIEMLTGHEQLLCVMLPKSQLDVKKNCNGKSDEFLFLS